MRFRFRPGLTAATLVALAILCSLGVWQLQRRAWKLDLVARADARLQSAPVAFDDALARAAAGEDVEYQPVFAEGVYRHDAEARVFGTYGGKAGVYVFAPLQRQGPEGNATYLYINRGFAPQDFAEAAMRADGLVAGNVRVEGLLRRAEKKRGFEKSLAPKDQPTDNLYFSRDPATLAAAQGFAVPGYYIDSFGRESFGAWPKGGLTRVEFPNRHLEYALTWFGLAAALLGVFLAYSRRT
ncbi:MAG: SURF1 family protein [Parvularculaceae bacterium]